MNAPGLCFTGRVLMAGRPLFDRTGFTAPAGQWTCLLGASGVGKTTILRLFSGTAEGVTLDGEAVADDGRPLAGRVALMAQSDMLLPWLNLHGNLMLGARLRGTKGDSAQAEAILMQVGLGGLSRRKPGALSGGQRQRAALARTLMEDRPVVLLDEPFSALDVATRARMQDLTAAGVGAVTPPPSAPPRAPDAGAVLTATGQLTRLLLEAA